MSEETQVMPQAVDGPRGSDGVNSTDRAGAENPPPPCIGERLMSMEKAVTAAAEQMADREQGYERTIQIAASCQQDTARLLNREIQRHALHPAILALVLLADEIKRIREKAIAAEPLADLSPEVSDLIEAVNFANCTAEERLAALDVEQIRPQEGSPFDANLHELRGTIPTDDDRKHGAVAKVVSSGVVYRGEVLRRVQVLVFSNNGQTRANATQGGIS